MALVWADGFDHYGEVSANALQNGYSQFVAVWNTALKRTGRACVRFENSFSGTGFRRPMAPSSRLVQGAGWRYEVAVAANRYHIANGFKGESASGVQEYRVSGSEQLGFVVVDRTNAVVGTSAPGLTNLGAWNWVEVQADKNSGGVNTGRVEVRLEGEPVLVVNGINLPNDFQNHCVGNLDFSGLGGKGDLYVDDYTVCDVTGVKNNSFLGDRRCDTSVMDADTVEADWAKVGGATGFGILDNIPPNDAQYIEALLAGDISEFEHAPLTVASNDVAGVIAFARLMKSDAGISTVRLGINSNGFVDNGPAVSPGTSFNYFNKIWELNPDGNIPWTRAAVDAALLRLTRDT